MNDTTVKNNSTLNINTDCLCDTSHLGIIQISGEEAQSFLQGQFSNDINEITDSITQLNSYNSPKGRMYASFQLAKIAESYYMILPREILGQVIKRLRMFVMRAKVTLEDLSEQWATFGISGAKASSLPFAIPTDMNQISQIEDCHLISLNGPQPRILFMGKATAIQTLREKIPADFQNADADHWQRLDIHAGIPNIYADTQEDFVAQMVNLQLAGGVSFTKGCYPGQEVVARMHYLGKLKKRMYRVSIDSGNIPKQGENIYLANSDNQQSIGQVVDSRLNDTNGLDALAVLQIAHIENGDLRLASPDGEKVSLESLPYSFEENQ